jgi:acyl-CoA dehydrogenase
LGVTEPNAGVNTLKIETSAKKDGNEYVINGQKTWNSGTDWADMMLLSARTSEYDPENPTHGITLFLVPTPSEQDGVTLNELNSVAPWYEKQFQVLFDDLRISEDQVLGDVDQGFYQFWDTLNTERISLAATCIGSGLRAIDLGTEYANDRKVFDDQPIGSHQAIQHPLADAYAKLMSAREMTYKASWKWDNDMVCGFEANTAKLLASEAAEEASSNSIQAHGGNAFNEDYDVFTLWVNSRILQIAPIPNEMIKNFIGEHELGMPASY